MHRCYPMTTFERAATDNGWRLRDARSNHIWITVTPPIGRLVVTRHVNGRLQVQGVPNGSAQYVEAQRAIHAQLWAARNAQVAEIARQHGLTTEQAARRFEDEWAREQSGRRPSPQVPLGI